jgi:E3 ubiquitin-protein ligase FANCL
MFNMSLTKPANNNNNNEPTDSTDCGICFDITTTTTASNACEDTNCTSCENPKCARSFHRTCLERWLTSLITSRISFDTIIGNCPYCKDPIAVQMS